MKYIFFGTPEFAAAVLDKLVAAGFSPAAVVCNPDKPAGRKKIITPPAVKRWVVDHESGDKNRIKILQPEKLDQSFLDSLLKISDSFDFFVVVAYAKIIPGSILKLPRLGVIGVHPSLLPKYRGATPIQSVILSGEAITGVTLYLMDEKVDHGPILAASNLELVRTGIRPGGPQILNLNYLELQKELTELAGNLLVEMLPKFLAGNITPQKQDEARATYTKKFTSEEARIDPEELSKALSGENPELALNIDRKIRALNPEPGVWTTKDGKRMKLLEAEIVGEKLRLKTIQMEGKKPQVL